MLLETFRCLIQPDCQDRYSFSTRTAMFKLQASSHSGMARFGSRLPCAANIGHLDLDAFDVERNRGRARQRQFDRAIRSLALLLETQRQQRQHLIAIAAIDAERANGKHALEDQSSAAALEPSALARRTFPDEAIGGKRELGARGDQSISPTLKTLSCICADMIARSSSSSATSFRSVIQAQSPKQDAEKCERFSTSCSCYQTGIAGMAMRQTREIRCCDRLRNRNEALNYSLMRSTTAPHRVSFSSSRSKPRSRW